VEGYHFEIRKHLVDYDDVVNKHREVVYGERKTILENADLKANIQSMIDDELHEMVRSHVCQEKPKLEALLEDASRILPLPPTMTAQAFSRMRPEEIESALMEHAREAYQKKEEQVAPENMRILERLVMLRTLDSLWMEHLTMMDHMRQGIGLQAVAQSDPLVAYKREGHALFQSLLANVQHDVVHTMYHVDIAKRNAPARPSAGKTEATPGDGKVGRNDPCPCGSGKKYKRCCGQ
ncbi:MAG: SEC-C metal-binding domain-containing protein, partial [Chloroflexi bacterium]|nr:SEC-C metal-binding domain-containing protein [Chloroflexota bacterium]